ncbi:unnamed protein product [Cuscuta epithymum]|uniref:Retrovirus-related Pol polyprotein from transposon TNT 1-94-like beta-barrel domain-containing protein n=1 Tax=Cuscuta epithymum TaxID=186058 RepID=A0AAV0G5N1_9ASTE|nr:unnamed protein product [Cuscuta epithymum]
MTNLLPFFRPWIIDSGAFEHITCDNTNSVNVSSSTYEQQVRIPNGDLVPIHAVSSLYLPNGLYLRHVLYIPKFQCNLLSASRLTKDLNCTLAFFQDFCVLQDLPLKKSIGVGRFRDGLYYLDFPRVEEVAMSVSINSDLWHQRLGHASDGRLHHTTYYFSQRLSGK